MKRRGSAARPSRRPGRRLVSFSLLSLALVFQPRTLRGCPPLISGLPLELGSTPFIHVYHCHSHSPASASQAHIPLPHTNHTLCTHPYIHCALSVVLAHRPSFLMFLFRFTSLLLSAKSGYARCCFVILVLAPFRAVHHTYIIPHTCSDPVTIFMYVHPSRMHRFALSGQCARIPARLKPVFCY